MKRSTQNWLKISFAVMVAVALAAPLAAQGNAAMQPVVNGVNGSTIDIGMLQRTGPGGDLEHAAKVSSLDVTNPSCTPFCSECHWLDSYNAVNTYVSGTPGSDVINTLTTTNALANGTMYLITITGDSTYWGNSYWTAPIGNPGTSPMFPSPDVPIGIQGYVGGDWEYLFGYPNNNHGNLFAGGPGHMGNNMISLDNGATFHDLVPVGGMVYNAGHVYQFLVFGLGQKEKFSVSDQGPHNDNYGQFWICVQAVTLCGSATPPAQ
jgi:hypothetical protein